MYAVVATVQIEDVKAAREALADLRVGLVPRAPGFVSAYWLAPVDGIGMSVIVFNSKGTRRGGAQISRSASARRHSANSGDP